jgi:integrase
MLWQDTTPAHFAGQRSTVFESKTAKRTFNKNGKTSSHRPRNNPGRGRDGRSCDGNPACRTRLPKGGQSKEIVSIDPVEVRHLLDKLPTPSKPIAWLAMLTGLRIGELLALRWRVLTSSAEGYGYAKRSMKATSAPRRRSEAIEGYTLPQGSKDHFRA